MKQLANLCILTLLHPIFEGLFLGTYFFRMLLFRGAFPLLRHGDEMVIW